MRTSRSSRRAGRPRRRHGFAASFATSWIVSPTSRRSRSPAGVSRQSCTGTQRRVNALERVFLPEYRDTIRFIEGTLEEREREELFHRKRAKSASRSSWKEG